MFQPVHHSTVYTTETHTHAVKQAAALCLKRRHGGAVHTTDRYGERDTIQSSWSSGAKRTVPADTDLTPKTNSLSTRRAACGVRRTAPRPAHACAVGGARVPESESASPPSRALRSAGEPGTRQKRSPRGLPALRQGPSRPRGRTPGQYLSRGQRTTLGVLGRLPAAILRLCSATLSSLPAGLGHLFCHNHLHSSVCDAHHVFNAPLFIFCNTFKDGHFPHSLVKHLPTPLISQAAS